MQISLTRPELEEFVKEQLRSGHYTSAEEVISGALSLLQAHEQLPAGEIEEFRAAIAVGIEQAERGETDRWDAQEITEEVERRYSEEQKSG
jgi:putative addiction module CopG family antidote